jgi:hypothetical protein
MVSRLHARGARMQQGTARLSAGVTAAVPDDDARSPA